MRATIALCIALLTLYPGVTSARCNVPRDQTLRFVSDPYPPYVMDGKHRQGYVTDIVLKVFHDAGYKNAIYVDAPYARALFGIKNGFYTGLLAVSPGRKHYVYPTQSFMGYFQNQFFVRKNSSWRWTGQVDSLKHITLGVIRGYEENDALDAYVARNASNDQRIQITSGAHGLENLIRMLVAGRINAFFEDTNVADYTAHELHLKSRIRPNGGFNRDLRKNIVTVGFDEKNACSQHFIDILNKGIPKLKASGELKTIIEKYGLEALPTHSPPLH